MREPEAFSHAQSASPNGSENLEFCQSTSTAFLAALPLYGRRWMSRCQLSLEEVLGFTCFMHTPYAPGQRLSRWPSLDQAPQESYALREGLPFKGLGDELVERCLHSAHTSSHLFPFRGQRQRHHPAVRCGWHAFDEVCLDQPVDQSTWAAALTDEQLTQCNQRQRLMLLKHSQHLCLRG